MGSWCSCDARSLHCIRRGEYTHCSNLQLSVCFIVLDLICCLRDLLHVVAEVAASPLLARNTMRVGDIAMLALQPLCAIKAIADGLRHVTVLATPTLPESALFFCNSRKGCDTQTLPEGQPQSSVQGCSCQLTRQRRSSSPRRASANRDGCTRACVLVSRAGAREAPEPPVPHVRTCGATGHWPSTVGVLS